MLLQSAVFVAFDHVVNTHAVEFDENFSKSQGGMVAVEIYSHIKRLVKLNQHDKIIQLSKHKRRRSIQ